MTVDLEEQLRAAYDALPADDAGCGRLAERAQHFGTRRKQLRTAAGVSGVLVAAAAVTAIVLGTGSLGTGASTTGRLQPAGQSVRLQFAHATTEASKPSAAPEATPGYDEYVPPDPEASADTTPPAGSNKKVAGLAGYLLPHGSQLPAGLSYAPGQRASKADGDADGAAVVPGLVAARSNLQNDNTKDTTGQLAGVIDGALNYRADGSVAGDGNPNLRSLMAQIIVYRTAAQARSAVPSAQASRGGWVWFNKNGAVQLTWPGVAGADGPSYLHRQPPLFSSGSDVKFKPTYIAVQIDGRFAIAATGNSQQDVSSAITSMIANLKAANLL